ncbi:MAG TPA: hypothetical protein VFB59_02695 [Candidatus Saccharimonadales bacterium]|nr:hypothetical protein [Candidatus Saccharimonadales bacterium]
MTEDIGSGTAQGVVDFLSSLVKKGRSRPGVVAPLKIALTKILEKTEGDNWQRVDVTKLDVDDAIVRFKNLTLGTYTDASYRAYELRAKRAIDWYKHFLANPGWVPKESHRAITTESKRQVKADEDKGGQARSNDKSAPIQARELPSSDNATHSSAPYQPPKAEPISYPFPLQSGDMARIYMPKSVTKTDIARLSTFLEALVIEEAGHEEGL